jgi:hypothetical protein
MELYIHERNFAHYRSERDPRKNTKLKSKRARGQIPCDLFHVSKNRVAPAHRRIIGGASLRTRAASCRQSFDWPSNGDGPLRPCHQTGETRHDGPPSFVDVANLHSTKTLSSRVFLRLSHKEMPNLIISDSKTDDLIAYIINLKQPSAPKRP